MKFCVVLQARLGSKRLPSKILKKIYKNHSSLSFLVNNIKNSNNNIVVATTLKTKDNKIIHWCKKNKINYFRGSENNVFERYEKTSKKYKIKNVIRLTSDCPLIDFQLLKKMKKIYLSKKLDYISNTLPIEKSKFPNGSDIEIFKTSLFQKYKKISNKDKEHVTNLFWKDKKIKKMIYPSNKNLSHIRYTLDYQEDLIVIKKIINFLKNNKKKITYTNISNFLIRNPQIMNLNKSANNIFQGNKIK